MPLTYRIAVLDTETTGLSSVRDSLVEIAVMLLEVDGETGRLVRELDTYQSLQDPGRPIPPSATAIHGITDAMVRGHYIDPLRLGLLLQPADRVVAHNCGFDRGFVGQVLPQADRLPWACSCRGIPWRRLYAELENTRLQHLAARLGVPAGTAHRALGDVQTTVNLLLRTDALGNALMRYLLPRAGVARV